MSHPTPDSPTATLPLPHPYLHQTHTQRARYARMLQGDFGGFFDSLSAGTGTSATTGALFPRLEAMLKAKKADWSTALPTFPNYFRAIANLISDFTIGSGVDFHWRSYGDAEAGFQQWWRTHGLDELLLRQLSLTIATGVSGLRLTWHDGQLLPTPLGFANFLPLGSPEHGFDQRSPRVGWVLGASEFDQFAQQHDLLPVTGAVLYTITYQQGPDGYHATHQLTQHATPTASGQSPTLRPDLLPMVDPSQSLHPDGSEQFFYSHSPVTWLHSPLRDPYGLGQSAFTDIVSEVQTLAFLETVTTIEMQTHFLSKLAVPRSMVSRRAGRPQLKPMEFLAFEDDGQLPRYIQKDNKFFTDLWRYMAQLRTDIALETSVPYELLAKDHITGNERVELARIRTQPFRRLIGKYQRAVRQHIYQLAESYWTQTHGEVAPRFRIELPSLEL